MNTGTVFNKHAVVIGGGAIARALVARLSADDANSRVTVLARGIEVSRDGFLATRGIELQNESSIAAAANFVSDIGPVDTLIVATGVLHNGDEMKPEKRLSNLTPKNATESFSINALGPALIAKHMLPLMRGDRRNVFAALSARVGSIEDNRLGGWYSYRAAKAALNMFLKCAAIEQARLNRHSVVVGLHPGTVDSPLSKPFQRNVPEGALFEPEYAATRLLEVLDGLGSDDSGRVFAWDGARIPG